MQYYRCKCGNSKSWGSMGPASCEKCSKCGSDLAQGPDLHSEPEPHEWATQYDQNTGVPYEVCRRCMGRRIEIEPPGPPTSYNPNIPKKCNGCGAPLLLANLYVDDGCPCNTPRGVNFKPAPCSVCKVDNCVKPGHRLVELFGEDVVPRGT